MKAMILAAGKGTRLRPYTDGRPKALVDVAGKPMIEHVIMSLIRHGYDEVIINLHHYGDQIRAYCEANNYFGIRIIFSDERDELLDTGGGLKQAAAFFDDGQAFLVHNTDILTDLDLSALRTFHLRHKPLATLAVMQRDTSRYFLFDEKKHLRGWKNTRSGESKFCDEPMPALSSLAFSGIHCIDPAIFGQITEQGVFSLTELYLRLGASHPILGYDHSGDHWTDCGKPEELKKAEEWLRSQEEEKP